MKLTNESILKYRKDYIYPNQNPYYKIPLQLVKAKGCYVWDEQGQQYIDAIGGIVSISVGHNHPRIQEKLMDMIKQDAIQHTTYLFLSQYMAKLAKKLAEVFPGNLSQCYITNSGSEANEVAVLTAREATGQEMMIALRYGYHGGTTTPLNLCGQSNWKFPHTPQAGVTHAYAPYCYRCPFGKKPDSCQLECADDVERVIETTTAGKIAGIIIEPILGVGGFIDPPKAYFKRVYEIVKSYGGLYISDEVQTGMGRCGERFFEIEQQGVLPDLITTAKGLGSGAPIGAVIADAKYAQALTGRYHFNTFGGDPYQSMQAHEVIEIIFDEKLIENAKKQGQYIKSELISLQKQFPLIGDIRGRGLLLGIELVRDRKTKEPAHDEAKQVMEAAKKAGLLIGIGGYYRNVLRIAPPLSINNEQSVGLIDRLKNAFNTVR